MPSIRLGRAVVKATEKRKTAPVRTSATPMVRRERSDRNPATAGPSPGGSSLPHSWHVARRPSFSRPQYEHFPMVLLRQLTLWVRRAGFLTKEKQRGAVRRRLHPNVGH